MRGIQALEECLAYRLNPQKLGAILIPACDLATALPSGEAPPSERQLARLVSIVALKKTHKLCCATLTHGKDLVVIEGSV